jgi:hypothetical protein
MHRLEDGCRLADVRPRGHAEPADQTGGQVAHDVPIQVREHEHVVQLRLLDQLHAHVVDDPVLELDAAGVLGRHLSAALQEEPVGQLHDVGLVDGGDLASPIAQRVLERVARNPLRRGAGDDLDALRRIGPHPVLDAGVQVLGVLADDDQVDVGVARLDAGHAAGRAHVGIELQSQPQPHVHAAKAGADRGRDRSLDRHPVATNAFEDALRERRPLRRDGRLAGLLHLPGEADPGRLQDTDSGLGELGADPIAGDQSDGVGHGRGLRCAPVTAPAVGMASVG